MSPTAARMLVEAGYDSTSKVAAADGGDLSEALARVNERGRFFKGKIGLRDVRRLIRAAGYAPGEAPTWRRRRLRALETFTETREFVESAHYAKDRQDALEALDLKSIDALIVDVVAGFSTFPQCFTLQCCCGHFVCAPGQSPRSLEPIAPGCRGAVTYRIAYLALCLENSPRGWALREALARIPEIAPGYVQFGSADWFWERWVNSCVLQVEPAVHRLKHEVVLGPIEPLRTQRARTSCSARSGRFWSPKRAGIWWTDRRIEQNLSG